MKIEFTLDHYLDLEKISQSTQCRKCYTMQYCNTATGTCNTAICHAYWYVLLLVHDDFCTPNFRIPLLNKKQLLICVIKHHDLQQICCYIRGKGCENMSYKCQHIICRHDSQNSYNQDTFSYIKMNSISYEIHYQMINALRLYPRITLIVYQCFII